MPAPVASIKFESDVSAVRKDIQAVNADFGTMGRSASSLNSAMIGMVGAFLSYQTVLQVLKSAKLGEEFENARAQFGRLVTDVEAGTQRLRAAVNGTLDDLKIYQLANEALRAGLDFTTVEKVFQFAEMQSDATGDAIATVFESVTQAMARTEQGFARAGRSLVRYGIYATDTETILKNITSALDEQTDSLNDNLDAVAQAETAWTNMSARLGMHLKTGLLPTLQSVVRLFDYFEGQSVAAQLGKVSDAFTSAARKVGARGGLFPHIDSKDFEALGVLQELRNAASDGSLSLEQTEQALARLRGMMEGETRFGALAAYGEMVTQISEITERLRTVRATTGTQRPGLPFGPTEEDAKANEKLLNDATRAAEDAARKDREALQAKRDLLQQERDLIKANIGLGLASYQDLDDKLAEQKATHAAFLQEDAQAYVAWAQDKKLVYDNDARNAAESHRSAVRDAKQHLEDIMADEEQNYTERLFRARAAADQFQKLYATDAEAARWFMEYKKQLDDEYLQLQQQRYQDQLNLLNSLFGQPALQLVDSFFTQSEVRFEDFIKNLLRTFARYAVQLLLMRLFMGLMGSPAGLPGGASGGGSGIPGLGMGPLGLGSDRVLPNPYSGLPDLSGLSSFGGGGRSGSRSASPVTVNLPPPHVTLLITDEGIAARAEVGNRIRSRTNLSS